MPQTAFSAVKLCCDEPKDNLRKPDVSALACSLLVDQYDEISDQGIACVLIIRALTAPIDDNESRLSEFPEKHCKFTYTVNVNGEPRLEADIEDRIVTQILAGEDPNPSDTIQHLINGVECISCVFNPGP